MTISDDQIRAFAATGETAGRHLAQALHDGSDAPARRRPKHNYTPEFRAEAVRVATASGKSNHQVAEELGLNPSTLSNWLGKARDHQSTNNKPDTDTDNNATDTAADRQAIEQLKRLVKQLADKERQLTAENTALRAERDGLMRSVILWSSQSATS